MGSAAADEKIGSLLVAEAEAAFGLQPGALITKGGIFQQNGWTTAEGPLLRLTRFNRDVKSGQNGKMNNMVRLGRPLMELLPGGGGYREHLIYGGWRLYNAHASYTVFGYVDQNTRLVAMVDEPSEVTKMTDLFLMRLCPERCSSSEAVAWTGEGPNYGEFADHGQEGNFGIFFASFCAVENFNGSCCCGTPRWVKHRAKQVAAEP